MGLGVSQRQKALAQNRLHSLDPVGQTDTFGRHAHKEMNMVWHENISADAYAAFPGACTVSKEHVVDPIVGQDRVSFV